MKLIDILTEGKLFAETVQKMQRFGEVGLGDTLADVSMCSACLQWLDQNHGIQRDYYGDGAAFSVHAKVRLHRGGMPRFRLSHGLAAKFALTDCDGIDPDELRLPFSTFMIELPFPQGPILMNDANLDRPVDSNIVIVNSYNACDIPFEPVGAQRFDELVRGLAGRKRSTAWNQRHLSMLALSSKTAAYLYSFLRVDEKIVIPEPPTHEDNIHGLSFTDKDSRATTIAWRIIVNLVLYLRYTESGAASVPSGNAVNHEHGLNSIVYELGRDVKLERNLRDASRAFCISGKKPEGWILAKRFVVRGHWKKQPYGPGRTERKMIFVEPYWKGPADAPAVARAYTSITPEEST